MEMSCVHENISTGWMETNIREQDRLSDSEETIVSEPDDDSKIKPEVELKEETDNFVYKTDFRGHLQLVSLGHGVPNQCVNHSDNRNMNLSSMDASYSVIKEILTEKCDEDKTQGNLDSGYQLSDPAEQWSNVKSAIHSPENGEHITISWHEESEDSGTHHIYRQLENVSDGATAERYFVKEEQSETSPQACSYAHTLPEIYDYSSDSTWEPQLDSPSQLPSDLNLNGNIILLTQAEKKRLYRLRIKEENPALWSTIKKREAARKREQREKRRHIIFEMQKALELSDLPESPEVVNQKLYVEALKERYPELWSQLINALPATQMRNDQLYNGRNSKSRRHLPKPARMYKDVIEAQKKRLYRQRIKEERPEMYERQKARDAYARSIQRLTIKKKITSEKNEYDSESSSFTPDDVEKKLTYLQNVKMEGNLNVDSKSIPHHLDGDMNDRNNNCGLSNNTHGAEVPLCTTSEISSRIPHMRTLHPTAVGMGTKSDPSAICDNNNHSEEDYNLSKNGSIPIDSNISNRDKTKEPQETISNTMYPDNSSTASSTQSNILWYWNDVRNNQPSEKVPVTPHVPYAPWRKGPNLLTEEERLQKILKERMHLKEKRKRYRMSMSPEKRTEFLEVEKERLKAYRVRKKAIE